MTIVPFQFRAGYVSHSVHQSQNVMGHSGLSVGLSGSHLLLLTLCPQVCLTKDDLY